MSQTTKSALIVLVVFVVLVIAAEVINRTNDNTDHFENAPMSTSAG